ncbi:MAG: cytochrome P450 [Acidimicrobiales bacterium]
MTMTAPVQPTDAPPDAVRAADFIDVDLSANAIFEAGVPHDAFETLRREAPVAWHHETPPPIAGTNFLPSPGFWAVTSHALVTEVSRTPALFSSWLGGVFLPTGAPPTIMTFRQMMLNMDPPEHSRLRRILQPIFTPRAVTRLHESVVRNANDIVDEIAGDGGCDLVTSVSGEMPVRVLADLLGMPREDRHLIFDWSNKLIGIEDPEYGGDLNEALGAAAELFAYGKTIADARRAIPTDDLISLIANAEVDAERLTDVEFAMFWLLLIIAGNETTRNSLSGGIIALLEHDRWDWIRDRPDAMPLAVEELVRHVSPVIQFRRTATQDTTLGGQHIRAGDKVVVWYSSANRDSDVFDDPHGLDLTREPNPHVAFGIGPHFCLGAHLARLELSTILGVMLQRLGNLEISGPVERVRSNFISGIRHLPVTYHAIA